MQIISYEQIISQATEVVPCPTLRLGYLTYLYGVPQFALVREAEPSDEPSLMMLKVRPYGLELSIMHDFKPYYVGLPFSAIRGAELSLPTSRRSRRPSALTGLRDQAGITDGNAMLTLHVVEPDQEYHIVSAVPRDKWQQAQEFIERFLCPRHG